MTTSDAAGSAEDDARTLMARRIRGVLAVDPGATALTFQGRSFPWSYYADAIADLDTLLAGFPDAKRVGIVLRNRPAQLSAVVATIATGRSVVTLSPHLGDVGLAEDIIDQAPDVLIADTDDWSREAVTAAAESVGAVPVCAGVERALVSHPVSWLPAPALKPTGGVAVLMMTSGTTGRPKRVELTYPKMVAAFRAAGTPVDDAQEPRLYNRPAILWASLAHISGLYFVIAHALEGRGVALLEKFDVDDWVELVREHRPGYVRLAPTALRMVLNAELPREVFESVSAVGSGTAPLPPDLADAFEERYGVPVLGVYGATEFAGAIAGWSLKAKREWGARKRGSAGRAHPGVELRIVDPQNGDLRPTGQVGLLEARGGQLSDDGSWVRTTDLASLDEDGFLFIHGRADDAINRGGFKIPPSVIEDALAEHPAVDESSAVGVPHVRLGEVPVVAVTLTGPATEDELLEFLAQRLTRYQRPVELKIVDQLPRTPSMKISRAIVREQIFRAGRKA
ncbi:class I adenylate-forming enzyme family protein [Cryptosporangium sp. NPDC048952]|uniref:class I adenylate-forming enzyme family protein n=1 Tax=Cryptosporangium sp. NPDC048952 TaxID=3363961 RepID=UPI00371714E6